jgi:hypothetical protein
VGIFKHETGARWIVALCAWVSTVGCATPAVATHPGQAEQPPDVINYVLVIKGPQGVDTAHVWLRSTEFDWPEPDDSEVGTGLVGSVEFASQSQRDCAQEQIDCFRRCWKRKPPYPRSYKKYDHNQYCREKCLKEYMTCLETTGQKAMAFPSIHNAVEWVKRHRREIAVGSVVFAAGFAFVVVSVAGGLLVLAPIAVF